MEEQKNQVTFITEDNEEVQFNVMEQTKLNGYTYLLVTDSQSEGEDGVAYILKDLSAEGDEASLYTIVEDEEEMNLIADIFEELLEDVEFES
ncbi:DUF1292 domain-containing protein [Anaerocolumna sp. AGMB13020]|uniref:DUF1292 domain-containing protein n=1 Tax=Anaerocolumna sp. AGMB13020 TaxID=3081750 RepID=UPI00295386F2|nr:DUF1292 domain-containing protein [Anaerocolumna sp. AGMB13020]WOO36667.1 DUF1292 domain-containing protein [Anaerocolumna sp. AGMB13020]